jgi:hypothetical protein
MHSFGNPLAKAIFYFKVKVQNYFDAISRRIGASVSSEIQEGTEGSSARLFWLLNLIFLASLVLLSPDKVTEVLPSARPNWLAFDWIQDVAETLGKLAPF